ncbi:MAG: tetratricopeptide repeat protein [Bryobacteraceae bacterium]
MNVDGAAAQKSPIATTQPIESPKGVEAENTTGADLPPPTEDTLAQPALPTSTGENGDTSFYLKLSAGVFIFGLGALLVLCIAVVARNCWRRASRSKHKWRYRFLTILGLGVFAFGVHYCEPFLLRKAAEHGSIWAQARLGDALFYGKGLAKNESEAVRWWIKAAEQGNVASQRNAGMAYKNGWGVEKNVSSAAKWYQQAADQNDIQAQLLLGKALFSGDGGSAVDGVKMFQKLADQGNTEGMVLLGYAAFLGKGTERSNSEAIRWWRKAAEEGNTKAMIALGDMYSKGQGLPKDEAEALKLLQRAAEMEDPVAQSKLAGFYFSGKGGIVQDHSEAMKLWRKAAEQGNVEAQYVLGMAYSSGGLGVVKDRAQAKQWLTKAVDGGSTDAQTALEVLQSDQPASREIEGQNTAPKDQKLNEEPTQDAVGYEAILTCGMSGGAHLNIMACFTQMHGGGTDLELRNGDKYGLYKVYNLRSLGREDRDGLHIMLEPSFAIKAQNASDSLILGLVIKDSSNGKVVFQRQASQFSVIRVEK